MYTATTLVTSMSSTVPIVIELIVGEVLHSVSDGETLFLKTVVARYSPVFSRCGSFANSRSRIAMIKLGTLWILWFP